MGDPWNAATYFEHVAKKTCQEYLDAPSELRRGMLAAIVLAQTPDYVAIESEISSGKLKKAWSEENKQFAVVVHFANASKHCVRDKDDIGGVATPVKVRPPSRLGLAFVGETFLDDPDGVIFIEYKGAEYNLKVTIEGALEFVAQMVAKHGGKAINYSYFMENEG